ncbi:MAG: DUF2177 family protein [Alphaproteobacteria bacterium]|nr:DUF2177 family protein [Alphaproteobacteria bacterium]
MNLIIAYAVTTISFLAIDAVWLGVVAKKFYSDQMGDLMLDNINFAVAAVFYLFYTVGIVVFAIKPAIAADNILLALGYGALFGFLAYGTYDFTNMATVKDWPFLMSFVDIAWGTVLTASAAGIGFFLTTQIVEKL